ncbi:odorant receptor 46a-like isoform X2 [Cotesia typhae]|uniref:odorant receptor 46a-like isoform X2 n=1 Tax=Cotesia typhae TaxID=2053667 RepID=UPI003D689CAD
MTKILKQWIGSWLKSPTMTILDSYFLLLSLAGLWKPRSWRGIKAFCYYIYQLNVVLSEHLFIISGALDLQFKNTQLEALIDNLALLLVVILCRQKMACVISNREAVKSIIDSLGKPPFKPRDLQEELIIQKFNRFVKKIFIFYPTTFIGALLVYSGSRSNVVDPPYILPYKGWFPYNYTSPTIYWITALFQLYAVYIATAIDLVFDLLLAGILCYLRSQVGILQHRFQVMVQKLEISPNREQSLVAEWVQQHVTIVNLVKYLNKIFSSVIFVQYTSSSLILCYFGFLAGMYLQIFLQCFCAHMLTSEFLSVSRGICTTNWFNLSNDTKKSIVIIMYKCDKPVLITSGFFFVLSLDSFTKVSKLAYSIYNVLELNLKQFIN